MQVLLLFFNYFPKILFNSRHISTRILTFSTRFCPDNKIIQTKSNQSIVIILWLLLTISIYILNLFRQMIYICTTILYRWIPSSHRLQIIQINLRKNNPWFIRSSGNHSPPWINNHAVTISDKFFFCTGKLCGRRNSYR